MQPLRFYKIIGVLALLSLGWAGGVPAQVATQSGPDGDFMYAMQLKKDGYLDLAIQQFELFIQKYPQENRVPQALREIAEGKFQMQDFAGARSAFEKLLLRFPARPESRDALFRIGVCLARMDSLQAAAMTFERFARFNPTGELAPTALLRAGDLYIKTGQVKRARRILFDIPAQYPQNESIKARAQLLLLRNFVETGEYDRAFRAAEAFLARFSDVLANAEVWLIKARIHRVLKHYREALDAYEHVIQKYTSTPLYAEAVLESADMQFRLGDRRQAFERLQSLFNSGDSVRALAVLQAADLRLKNQEPARAVDVLKTNESLLAENPQYWALLARAHAQLQNWLDALQAYRQAAERLPESADSLRVTYLLRAGRAALMLRDDPALKDILERLSELKPSSQKQAAAVLYLQAQYAADITHDFTRAIRLYERYAEIYPDSPFVDDARVGLATAYERLGEWSVAAAEWQKLIQAYPASNWADTAARHVRLIRRYFRPDLSEAAAELASLPVHMRDDPERPVKLISAQIYMRFHEYEKAIALLKQLVAENDDPGVRNQAFLNLADSYFVLGEKHWLQQKPSAVSWFDSARVLYHFLRKKALNDGQLQRVDAALARIHLSAPDSTSSAFLDSLANAYPRSLEFEEVHLHILEGRLPALAGADSLQLVQFRDELDFWRQNAKRHPAKAALLLARFHLMQHDTASAIDALQDTDSLPKSAEWIRVQFVLSRLLASAHQPAEAEKRLRLIAEQYYYSPEADSAWVLLIRLANEFSRPKKVLHYLEKWREHRRWRADATDVPLSPDLQLIYAEALKALNDNLEASQAYLDYLNRMPGPNPRAPEALMALADLAKQLNTPHLARKYYQEILQNYADHPLAPQVKLLLAVLEFEQNNFKLARMLALEVFRTSKDDPEKMRRSARLAIVSGLRLGQISAVISEMKNYETRFPDDQETLAEIQFELGDLHLRRKNFKKAEDIFKSLRKKFKNTPYAIRGDFGLGKAYLIQNKTDDALDVLTDIPKKYPGHPFLRVVYLNLGDFYQAQQQWANAIGAFKKVLEDSIYDRHAKIAMRSLINLYERQGYVDIALKYTREYLQQYPNDDYSFNLKIKIGGFLRRLGQFQEAVQQYRRLLPLADGDAAAEIQFYIGETYFESGQFEKAIVEYLRLKYTSIKTKFPWRTTAVYKAGICYMRLRQYPRARKLFEWVVRMEGSGSIFGKSAQEKIREIDRQLSQLTSAKQND